MSIKDRIKKWLNDDRPGLRSFSNPMVSDNTIGMPDRAIRLTIYSASGGRVIETSKYNPQTDRSIQSLYIVTSDQDFGKEIDKILTIESLKN